jgi:hypothetical protein
MDAKTDYVIEGFCQTQSNVESSLVTNNFSTLSNGGAINKMIFNF